MIVPNCGCCSTCAIGADTFTEADNASVPGWTQVAGTSAIVSNALKMTASNTLVIFNTADATGGVEVNAQVDVIGATNEDVIRLIIKEKDGTNSDSYLAELQIGTGETLKLFKRVAGVETQLASTSISTTAGTKYTLSVCYGEGRVVAKETVTGTTLTYLTATTISTQLNAGLACGTITSNVQFTNFKYNHGYHSGANATCTHCGAAACVICSDDFTAYENGSDLGTDTNCSYTVDSGTAALNGSYLTLTASNTSIYTTKTNPNDPQASVKIIAQAHNTNDVINAYIQRQDGTHFYRAELTVGTNKTLKLFDGSGTQLATVTITTSANTFYTLNLCVGPVIVVASVTEVASSTISASISAPSTAYGAGLGCGAIAAQVDVKSFTFNRGYSATDSTCDKCHNISTVCQGRQIIIPNQIILTTAGFSSVGNNDLTGCAGSNVHRCPFYNASFDLGPFGMTPGFQQSQCHSPPDGQEAGCGGAGVDGPFPCGGLSLGADGAVGATVCKDGSGDWHWVAQLDVRQHNNNEAVELYAYVSSALPITSDGLVNPIGSFTLSFSTRTLFVAGTPPVTQVCNYPATVQLDVT